MIDIVLFSGVFNEVKVAEPLGICYLGAIAHQTGYSVEFIEPSLAGWSPEETARVVLNRPSKILGISILRDEQKADVYEFLRIIREANDGRFIVIGGHAPSIAITMGVEDLPLPYEGKIRFDQIPAWGRPSEGWSSRRIANRSVSYADLGRYCDTFMLGEADVGFPQLCELVLNGRKWQHVPGLAYLGTDNHFVITPPCPKPDDLDALPFMSRDILSKYLERFPIPEVAAGINLGRGCYYSCTFCTVSAFQKLQGGSKHRQRSVGSVVGEIKWLYKTYRITNFNFEDDNFIIKNKKGITKIYDLCDAICQFPFKINFSIFCRVDVVEQNIFAALKKAGLNIVYLGLESVHKADLEFFHKDQKLAHIFNALDVLLGLGYSPEVGAERRIKLGYITWHPLTTFAGLRHSVDFMERYNMPPKLLRRKLLLYSGIPIKEQIRSMGLLDPSRENGWLYKNPHLESLEYGVEEYIQLTVSRPYRDRIRNIEKTIAKTSLSPLPVDLYRIRKDMDRMCFDFVKELLNAVEKSPEQSWREISESFTRHKKEQFGHYIEVHNVEQRITEELLALNLPLRTLDLYRQ